MSINNLILVLGDQLTHTLSSIDAGNKDQDLILICEVMEEATYVKHHKKKIAFLFSAMRHFAEELREKGWNVEYIKLDDKDNEGSFEKEVSRAIRRHSPTNILITEPGEWRLMEAFKSWSDKLNLPIEILPDDRFIATHREFENWAADRKQLRMEYFYRDMRRKTDLLMNGDEPEGDKWNYDSENRKPAESDLFMPTRKEFRPDDITKEVLKLVSEKFGDHIGELEPFKFAVTAEEANKVLDHFLEEALPGFGDYQDAMLENEKFLYHSILSPYINAGLLDPLEVCKRVEEEYKKGRVPLNAAEGFIRQIIGWREYVRGIYWLKMPEYVKRNFFDHERNLPDFYWTGETDMNCMHHAISQTIEEAYAHHIQRLMITGNFAMLAGVDPHQVHVWYLEVYADAYEWVELPNTLGMSQFGDGGMLGSKPYAAGGNYINKMSNYCKNCTYNVNQKSGEGSCPFNSLYWDFMVRNRNKLKGNSRVSRVYSTWDRMDEDKQKAYRDTAKRFLDKLS